MNEGTKDKEGNTANHYYAQGVMWFLIWIGFGGCCALNTWKGDKPVIQIELARP